MNISQASTNAIETLIAGGLSHQATVTVTLGLLEGILMKTVNAALQQEIGGMLTVLIQSDDIKDFLDAVV